MHCGLQIDRFDIDTNTMMYECESCFEIFHAQCLWVFLFITLMFIFLFFIFNY
jgi:hypothetical protein